MFRLFGLGPLKDAISKWCNILAPYFLKTESKKILAFFLLIFFNRYFLPNNLLCSQSILQLTLRIPFSLILGQISGTFRFYIFPIITVLIRAGFGLLSFIFHTEFSLFPFLSCKIIKMVIKRPIQPSGATNNIIDKCTVALLIIIRIFII